MLLFSLECSAAAASAAIYRDEKLLGEEFLNVPQTHSVTLLPMAKSLLEHTGISPAQIQGKDGRLTRLSEDEALPLSELKEKLKSCTGPLWLCGDGAHLGLAAWGEKLPVKIAPAHLCYQRAAAVGLAAMQHLGEAVSPAALVPCYLRPANAMTLAERQKKAE